MTNTASRNADNIENMAKQGLRDTLDVASNAASNIGKEVQKGASQLGTAVKEMSTDAAKQFGEVGVQALEKATQAFYDATDKLQSDIKKSPYIALGVAFGLGMALTYLLNRK